eukprot:8010213-Pyramimonas_sp.AAC.1
MSLSSCMGRRLGGGIDSNSEHLRRVGLSVASLRSFDIPVLGPNIAGPLLGNVQNVPRRGF